MAIWNGENWCHASVDSFPNEPVLVGLMKPPGTPRWQTGLICYSLGLQIMRVIRFHKPSPSHHHKKVVQTIPKWVVYSFFKSTHYFNWWRFGHLACQSSTGHTSQVLSWCYFPGLWSSWSQRWDFQRFYRYPLVFWHDNWKWPIYSEFSHSLKMVIFHSYIKLPEGTYYRCFSIFGYKKVIQVIMAPLPMFFSYCIPW